MKTISRGDGEQMLAAFESKLDELQYSDIHSNTEVEASTKTVAIPDYAKDTFYKDVGGGFGGENGEVYSLEEIMQMWNSEHDNDPCMMEYDSFDDWFADTETNCLQEYWPDDIEECTDVTASIDYDKVDEIADRYSSSEPVSGHWSSETEHELNAISDELGVSKEEAADIMINYLGFDPQELQDITSATAVGSSSRDGMKTWSVSGYNYMGKAIVNQEIEARTKNAAIHKFEKMYGNIATRAEEA